MLGDNGYLSRIIPTYIIATECKSISSKFKNKLKKKKKKS